MPVASTTIARNEIMDRFKSTITAAPTVFTSEWTQLYQNMPGDIPDDVGASESSAPAGKPWFRAGMKHTDGEQAAIGGKKWVRNGFFWVQIFTPRGDGFALSDQAVEVITQGFSGKTTPGGVWFRKPIGKEVGADGNWSQVNFIVEFEYTVIVS